MAARAQELLRSALTFREAPLRDCAVPTRFASAEDAVDVWISVLLHEAREDFAAPLETRPERPFLHPVDVESTEPGIVLGKGKALEVLRRPNAEIARVTYGRTSTTTATAAPISNAADAPANPASFPVRAYSEAQACKRADASLVQCMNKVKRMDATDQRRDERKRERQEARARETPNARRARLDAARERRQAKRERAGAEDAERSPAPEPAPVPPEPPELSADPFELCTADAELPDASLRAVQARPLKRQGGDCVFYEHPIHHHRHLSALCRARPHANLARALLHGDASDHLEIIQGPPGTGKTSALVGRVMHAAGRVLLCAPTNVGAANLYERCVAAGYGPECSLVLPPDRIPPGTAVQSNDPARRIVCSTISSRAGPVLDHHAFATVLVDEAAQCMEAWIWTLMRPEVERVVLAGDVHQLPAITSESGRALAHARSLMGRLASDLEYENVTVLTVQNRMAPELLAFPNETFYGNCLVSGPHAPLRGSVEVHLLAAARETARATSCENQTEVDFIARLLPDGSSPGAVVLTPYAAQCRCFLGKGIVAHTVDSFQGREADTVFLSCVRDGCHGIGFWGEYQRVVVALTRARVRLVVVASNVHAAWPRDQALTSWLITEAGRTPAIPGRCTSSGKSHRSPPASDAP